MLKRAILPCSSPLISADVAGCGNDYGCLLAPFRGWAIPCRPGPAASFYLGRVLQDPRARSELIDVTRSRIGEAEQGPKGPYGAFSRWAALGRGQRWPESHRIAGKKPECAWRTIGPRALEHAHLLVFHPPRCQFRAAQSGCCWRPVGQNTADRDAVATRCVPVFSDSNDSRVLRTLWPASLGHGASVSAKASLRGATGSCRRQSSVRAKQGSARDVSPQEGVGLAALA